MHVLVTGGAGFIGSHTVDRLLKEGATVTVLDNLSTGHRHNLDHVEDDIRFIEGDIANPGDVQTAMAGCTHCINLAAQVSVPVSINAPRLSALSNIVGFATLYECALAQGVERIIYASSAAIYGDNDTLPLVETEPPNPLSPYGLEKLTNERQAAQFETLHDNGPSLFGLRYFNVFGPRQDPTSQYAGVISKFAECFSQGKQPTIFGDGKQTRDFVYVKDVAAINAAMLSKTDSGVSNVCRQQSTSLLELANIIGNITGVNSQPNFAAARIGDIIHSMGSNAHLKALGLETPTELRDGLAALIASLKS
ncbi:MAG: SDR family NAD(P)-dependent oxidoreductase [Alphaproteobacteria bacterium]